MKKTSQIIQLSFLFLSLSFFGSCFGQEETEHLGKEIPPYELLGAYHPQNTQPDPALNIATYVNNIFQDKNGAMWFGTVGRGAIRSAGDSLEYFTVEKGFGGKAVREILEDENGYIWFGTSGGVTKYDGIKFINFTEKDGLANNDVQSMAIDRNGQIWIGTSNGISILDGNKFSSFPFSNSDSSLEALNEKTINHIMEGSGGNVWFGTNMGAYMYDGKTFSHISQKDGLCDDEVNYIMEDKKGNIWFATQNNGVCFWDGNSFTSISTKKGFEGKNSAYHIYEDKSGNIWFTIDDVGVHKYDGKTAADLFQKQHCVSHTIRCTMEDDKGRIWFGGWLGVHRFDG